VPESGIGPLFERGGRVLFRTAVAIDGPQGRQIGHLVIERTIDAAASSALIRGMVGQQAQVFIGNRTGDVWTDLQRAITLPALDLATPGPRELSGPNGVRMFGAPIAIPNTKLVVMIALPTAEVMAPVWRLVGQLAATGIVFIGLSTIGAAILSARVTRPLDELTGAAQAMAAGDYAQRVNAAGRDEVARLGDAFNNMARQVEQARRDLEARARELSASQKEAQRANDAKDEFLAVLSHELRTPLNAILGWCQVLSVRGVPEPETRHAIAIIERNARAQLRLVDDLLDVSRIVFGRFSVESRPVDAVSVVRAAIESIQPAAADKGVDLRTTLPAAVRSMLGDAGRLQQAAGNLLANALKFTPTGGQIDVSLVESDGLEIVVQDNGEGIAAETLPRIFDRLQQGDHTAPGLGLGLAIVREIAELHGGRVSAASRGKGTGATFRLWLPRTSNVEPLNL
jgi:signal transduction histidine kinase